jgi:hypothetical protein
MIEWFQQHLAAIVGVALVMAFLHRWASNVARIQAKARIDQALHEVWPKLSRERKAAVLCVDGRRFAESELDNLIHLLMQTYKADRDLGSTQALGEAIRRQAIAMKFSGEELRAPPATSGVRAGRASRAEA